MRPAELLEFLSQRGIELRVDGGSLRYRAPRGGLTDELKQAIAACKEELIALVAARSARPSNGFRIEPAPAQRGEPFPMTDLQEAYWIGEQDFYDQHTTAMFYQAYDVPELDVERLGRAVDALVAAHDALRLAFLPDGTQIIRPERAPYRIACADLRGLSAAEIADAIARVRAGMAADMPALDAGTPFRFVAQRLPDRVRLHMAFRLIAIDGVSSMAVFRDLAALYADPGYRVPPCALSFRDYVTALVAHRNGADYQRSLDYWRARLDTLPGPPALPRAPGGGVQRGEVVFERLQRSLDARVWTALRERAQGRGLPVSSVLCAASADALRRWSERDRFTLNVMSLHRPPVHADIYKVLGNCSTTSLLQCDPAAGSFVERVRALQRQLYTDLQYNDVSGVALIRELQRRRGGDTREPFMPVVFTSSLGLGDEGQSFSLPLPGARLVDSFLQTPQVWLDQQVDQEDGELVITWDQVQGVFPDGMVADMFGCFVDHLEALASTDAAWEDRAARPIPAAQLDERQRANATAAPAPAVLLHEGFAVQVAERSASDAVIDAAGSLTYGELDARAGALAAALVRAGVTPGDLVGVVADKGWPQVCAVLAILAAGGAYLPLDGKLPLARIQQIARHSRIRVIAADARAAGRMSGEIDCSIVPVTAEPAPAGVLDVRRQAPTDIAYVIYTSGSTGQPKGVVIDHRGAVNTIQDVIRRFGLDATDRVLAISALGFDLSVYDIFGTLSVGAAIVMPPESETPDPQAWAAMVARHRVTVWNSVPALLEMMVEYLGRDAAATLSSLRLILLSGDWVPLALMARVREVCPRARVIALGGATEASIWSNYFDVASLAPGWSSVPYGFPLANQSLHVLDETLAPVPSWTAGDLYIGGMGVALGYLHDPERTAASFLVHPRTGERLYRTGDLARYRPGGVIEFLGRRDFQVKIRGFRIELGEIEAHLEQHPDVATAATVRAPGPGDGYLVAFVSAAHGARIDEQALRAHLSARLPGYMVPAAIVEVTSVPLSANGKIDRRALLARLGTPVREDAAAVPPRTALERALAGLWSELLGVAITSVTASFFEVGGNSLLAVRLMNRIATAYGCRLPLSSLFAHSTVASQAAQIEQHAAAGSRGGAEPVRVWIQRGDPERVLFLVHPVGGDVLCYRALASAMPGISVAGLRSPLLAGEPGALTIEDLAARYVEEIVAVKPDGPVHLGGWSMGAAIALEMARRLREAGRDLGPLWLIDSWVGLGVAQDSFDTMVELFGDLAQGAPVRALLAPVRELPLPARLASARDLLARAGVLEHELELAELERLLAVHVEHSRMLRLYAPPRVPVAARLFKAARAPREPYVGLVPLDDPSRGWLERVVDCAVEIIDADHYSIIAGDAAARIAGAIARVLRATGPNHHGVVP